MITNMHEPVVSIQPTVKRRRGTGIREDVNCPPCLPDYQHFMRVVDHRG